MLNKNLYSQKSLWKSLLKHMLARKRTKSWHTVWTTSRRVRWRRQTCPPSRNWQALLYIKFGEGRNYTGYWQRGREKVKRVWFWDRCIVCKEEVFLFRMVVGGSLESLYVSEVQWCLVVGSSLILLGNFRNSHLGANSTYIQKCKQSHRLWPAVVSWVISLVSSFQVLACYNLI